MSDIRKLLDIINETTVAGSVATVAAPMGEMQKRVEETATEETKNPEVIEYGMWENSALATTSKLKKNRGKSAKVVKSIYGEDVQTEAANPKQQAAIAIAKKKEVAEGKFTVNRKTGAKLDPRTGAELPPKEKPLTMKDMFRQPKSTAPKLTLNDVWMKIQSVVSNIYPDGDPIDHLAPWLEKHGIRDFKIGEILDRAAKKNGYKDLYDYWDSMGDLPLSEQGVAEETEQIDEVSMEELLKYVPNAVADLSNRQIRINTGTSTANDAKKVQNRKKGLSRAAEKIGYKMAPESVAEGSGQNLSVQQLATISDEALDKAYGYGRSNPGNTFGWQANLMSAAYAKKMIDAGVTDIEKISDAIHKGWNITAQKFVQNPDQFDDTEKLRQAGKLEAKLAQRAKLMKINYGQLDNEEQEKDRVVARALLQAIKGQQGVAEGMERGEYSRVLDALQLYYPRLSMEELNVPGYHKVIANKANVPVEYAARVINDFVKASEPNDDDWLPKDVAEGTLEEIDRRGFLRGAGAAAIAGAVGDSMARTSKPEQEYATLTNGDKLPVYNSIRDVAPHVLGQFINTKNEKPLLVVAQDGKKYFLFMTGKDIRGKLIRTHGTDVSENNLAESDLILNPASLSKLSRDLVSHEHDRTDHEVEMAKSDLYQAGKNAVKIFELIKDISEEEGLEGWVQEKIIKANDYLNTIREYLEGKQMESMDGVAPGTKMFTSEEKPGLWANIHAKRKRIKSGSGERMRKPGSKGAPSAQDFKDAAK